MFLLYFLEIFNSVRTDSFFQIYFSVRQPYFLDNTQVKSERSN
ncbi:hypothetical protein RT41_GL001309 [Lactococcus fujiensis JCM 16395]|uniref:Uncharacterized protein n=1 Tax=Lactococcus fujiensis JCM 16395 TaxID=1291764 RepID=A0A2A5RMA5_9LACT|nr:hypothetical protein RT41_GL001309 [Lactococcus fujiensis JCM 16395]